MMASAHGVGPSEKAFTGRGLLGALVILLYLMLAGVSQAQQQTVNAAVHLNNGLTRAVKIHSANSNGIMWSDRTSPVPQLMPHNQIAVVDFPAPDLWSQGNTFFNKGDFPKAIAAYSSLANDPRSHFYPTPGNYSSRAVLRLIGCYRETGDATAIVRTAAKLDAKSLPDSERGEMEVISAWAELAKGNYSEALAKAESITPNPISPARNDLGFIKAVSLENTGKVKEAIVAYGTAYSVDFGGSRELAKRSMQKAILLLIGLGKENREGELHSLVHAYAKVYNQGKLWDGAPAKAVELLGVELDIAARAPKPETESEPETAANSGAPAAQEDGEPGKLKINRAGDGEGYHIVGDGAADNQATAFRSTDVAKDFDVDGDNIYGTEGLFLFGDGGKVGNGQKFPRHTVAGADWASFSAGANFTSVAIAAVQGPMDDPTQPAGPTVADWSSVGVGVATPSRRTKNPWIEILKFSASPKSPQKFRIGIISGTQSAGAGVFDPEAIRIDGESKVSVISGLQNNGNGHPNWIFFDVDLNGNKSGKFTISGKLRKGGKGVSISGITFDIPTSD